MTLCFFFGCLHEEYLKQINDLKRLLITHTLANGRVNKSLEFSSTLSGDSVIIFIVMKAQIFKKQINLIKSIWIFH